MTLRFYANAEGRQQALAVILLSVSPDGSLTLCVAHRQRQFATPRLSWSGSFPSSAHSRGESTERMLNFSRVACRTLPIGDYWREMRCHGCWINATPTGSGISGHGRGDARYCPCRRAGRKRERGESIGPCGCCCCYRDSSRRDPLTGREDLRAPLAGTERMGSCTGKCGGVSARARRFRQA